MGRLGKDTIKERDELFERWENEELDKLFAKWANESEEEKVRFAWVALLRDKQNLTAAKAA